PGTLAVAVLAASPRCASALHYVLVERSPVLREHHGDHLPLAPPATSLGVPGAGDGPVVVSLAELPATELVGVILANELLDNLAVDLLIRTDDGWGEIRIGVGYDSGGGQLVHHVVPAAEPAVSAAQRFAPDAPVGATIPWQRQAGDWVRDGLALLSAGRLVVIDYAVDTTAELARRPMHEWLRTYRGHDRAGDPLDTVGTADITVEVCIDQLAWAAGEPTSVRRQGEFLRAHGIDELVAEGRRVWDERAHLGDLAAIRGRSRITEADALLDRDGLGAFRVVEWTKA
ncbi:MAG: SAM-dependent methyltransferase, partial [Acidimicrobiales bacterium]